MSRVARRANLEPACAPHAGYSGAYPEQGAGRTPHDSVTRGETVFHRLCAACHAGGTFGPDLGTVQHWPAQRLATDIADPKQSISSGYEFWSVVMGAGDALRGIIASETPTALTLKTQHEQITIARSNLANVLPIATSAMPEGLVANFQSMADLTSYLKRR